MNRSAKRMVRLSGFAVAMTVLVVVLFAQLEDTLAGSRLNWTKIDFGKKDQRTDNDWVPWSDGDEIPILLSSGTEVRLSLVGGADTEDRGDVEGDIDDEDVYRDGYRTSTGDLEIEISGLKSGPYTVVLISADGEEEDSDSVGTFDVEIDGRQVAGNQMTRSGTDVGFAVSMPIVFSSDGDASTLSLKRTTGEIWLNGLMLTEGARMEHGPIKGEVRFDSLPEKVRETIERELSGYDLDDIDRIASGRRVRYIIEGELDDDLKVELELDENGYLLQRAEDLEIKNLPAAVIRSIKALAPGSDIREVSRLITPRSSVFRVEVKYNGNEVILILLETGALVSRRQ